MRIAINGWFWDQPYTGSGQYTRHLLAQLVRIASEHEYLLVTPEASVRVTLETLTQTVKPLMRKPGLRKVWFEQVSFPRACQRLNADLAHVPYWGSPLSPLTPTLATIHDIIPLLLPEYRGNILARTYTGLVQSAAANAAVVVTDSEASKRDIVTHLEIPQDRIRVVYLAADAAYSPDPEPHDKDVRAQYGLPDAYILYLGGFDVRKNLRNLLQVWTFAEGPVGEHTPLVIAGHLPQHSAFTPDPRLMAQMLEIDPKSLFFSGPIEESHKPAVYRGAVCFLFPSRYEGFGLPPLEALSCGVPVIGSSAASLPEVVGDGGALFHPDDTRHMAGALIAIATEPETRSELSRRALAQAAGFSWERTARQTLAIYKEASLALA